MNWPEAVFNSVGIFSLALVAIRFISLTIRKIMRRE
ncbi:hypothetical protein SAMN05518855_1005144 [Paenibacillus sp. CF384]|nr:hypothetical protein SAMN05518855_1005144 [Paenibacillus sp. CF384]